jgi:hypothetical protein
MLFRKTVVETLEYICGQNVELFNVKAGGAYNNH